MEKIADTDSKESSNANWWELFQPHDCFEEEGDRQQGAPNGLGPSEAAKFLRTNEVEERE